MKSSFGVNILFVVLIMFISFSLMGAKCNRGVSTGFEDFTIRNSTDYTIKVTLMNANDDVQGERTIASGNEEDYMNIPLNWKFSVVAFDGGVPVKIWKWEGLDEIVVENLYELDIITFVVGNSEHGQWVDL